MSEDPRPDEIIRIAAVMDSTGLCRTMLYEKIAEGSFPRQVSLGDRAVGWRKSQVDEWISSRPVKLPNAKRIREVAHKEQCRPLGVLDAPLAITSRDARPKVVAVLNKVLDGRREQTAVVATTKSLSATAAEKEQIKNLRLENTRLKALLADLALGLTRFALMPCAVDAGNSLNSSD